MSSQANKQNNCGKSTIFVTKTVSSIFIGWETLILSVKHHIWILDKLSNWFALLHFLISIVWPDYNHVSPVSIWWALMVDNTKGAHENQLYFSILILFNSLYILDILLLQVKYIQHPAFYSWYTAFCFIDKFRLSWICSLSIWQNPWDLCRIVRKCKSVEHIIISTFQKTNMLMHESKASL